MTKQPYKPEEKLKVRVVADRSAEAADAEHDYSRDSDGLMDIITDPHAPEDEWLAACGELSSQSKSNSPCADSRKKKLQAIKMAAAGVAATGTLGAAIFLYLGAASQVPVGRAAVKISQKAVFREEVDFRPYMKALQKEIKSHWHPPKTSTSNKIQLRFKVHKNGEISDVGFDRMSRLSEVDAAALKAVIEAMPALPPLPAHAPQVVDVNFSFDYNVSNSQKSKPEGK